MLKTGEYVVKAGEGVCKVETTVMMKSFGGETENAYLLLIPVADSRSKIYVPEAEEYRDLRPVMDAESARGLVRSVPKIAAADVDDDKARETVYKEALKSADPERLVSIIKSMYFRAEERRARGKKTTAMDDRYLKLAEKALYSEIGFALNVGMDEVRGSVTGILKDGSFVPAI